MSALVDKRLRELLHLVSLLRGRPEGVHIKDVAAALGMRPRAALELIDTANMAGAAPFDPGSFIEIAVDKNLVRLELAQRLGKPVKLSRQEALGLVVALAALIGQGDLGPVAARALDRLRAALGAEVEGEVAGLQPRIAFEAEGAAVAERFAVLRRGMTEGRAVDLRYYSASRDAMTERRLRPYAVVQHLGQWYAVGRDSLRHEVRVFKVERVRSASLTDERFRIPASFEPSRYLKPGKLLIGRKYERARVRFRGAAARVIREEWPAELVEDGGDDTVIGTLHYVAFEGLANWLLAHGGDAEVIEPAGLRAALAARARAALALYE